MNLVIYEHPLNEKLRTYMRVEHLFAQLNSCKKLEYEFQALSLFSALFALVDLLERSDVRNELTKELERTEKDLVKWAQHPDICDDVLQNTLKKVMQLQSGLHSKQRICTPIKEEPFLASLKQRFSIPGGQCDFDLPQLHYWLQLDSDQRNAKLEHWLAPLGAIEQAVNMVMTFVRERGQFSSVKAPEGFYQDTTGDIEMLRIKYTPAYGAFPTVSGNKYRYALRFMQLCDEADTGRANVKQDIMFSLAKC